jgi:hypothetical protein
MKKFLPLTLFLAVVVAVSGYFSTLAPVAPAASGIQTSAAVQIPDALKAIFSAVLLAGVTMGLQAIFNAFGLDLRGVGAAVAVALSGFIIAQLQGYIDVVPVAYDHIIQTIFNVLVVILGGIGAIRAFIHPQHASNMFQQNT